MLGNRLLIIIALAWILLIYSMNSKPVEQLTTPNVSPAEEASIFPWLTDFTYVMDAPDYAKQFANKTTEKNYTFYNTSYDIAGTEVGALVVKVNVKSKPINEQETKIDFLVKAKHVYAKSDSFNIKKKKAEIRGYSILDSNVEKLSIYIPWAEILKNM